MVRPDLHLPPSFVAWLAPYLAAFSRRSRPTTAALAVGALLAVGPRTVTNCLRALGLAEHPGFTAFHRVLNRNAWSGLALARTLLRQVVATFVLSGPIIIGVDHTLERRRGPRIGPAGRFYDASLRADMPNPTSRGLRWLSAMVLVDVPFAGRVWALPVLTALTPTKAWSERRGRHHRPVTEWARPMRWRPRMGRPAPTLGMETQRRWSDPAVFRTTPLLLGLYSVVTLYVHQTAERFALSPRRAAWYPKPAPTFADALARLRRHLWFERIVMSAKSTDMTEPIAPELQGILDAVCYAP